MYIKALLKLDSTTIKPSCYSSEIDQLYFIFIYYTNHNTFYTFYMSVHHIFTYKYMFPVKSLHDSNPSYFGLATIPVQPSP